jgi:DNA-binding Lrp family transcriptional regulator
MLSAQTLRQEAYVMMICEQGAEQAVIEQLERLEGVREIERTYGSWDILARIQTESIESLRELITMKIRKIPKIQSTTTLIAI